MHIVGSRGGTSRAAGCGPVRASDRDSSSRTAAEQAGTAEEGQAGSSAGLVLVSAVTYGQTLSQQACVAAQNGFPRFSVRWIDASLLCIDSRVW
jgi:hypothetical protein